MGIKLSQPLSLIDFYSVFTYWMLKQLIVQQTKGVLDSNGPSIEFKGSCLENGSKQEECKVGTKVRMGYESHTVESGVFRIKTQLGSDTVAGKCTKFS